MEWSRGMVWYGKWEDRGGEGRGGEGRGGENKVEWNGVRQGRVR